MKKPLALAALATTLAAVPAVAATTRSVRVDDNVFRPSTLSANRGDTIRFRFVGDRMHNVRRVSGPSFRTVGTRDSGSVSRRVTRRGTIRLVCTLHSGMRMSLRVR